MGKSNKSPNTPEFLANRRKAIMERATKDRQQSAARATGALEDKSSLIPRVNVAPPPPPAQG